MKSLQIALIGLIGMIGCDSAKPPASTPPAVATKPAVAGGATATNRQSRATASSTPKTAATITPAPSDIPEYPNQKPKSPPEPLPPIPRADPKSVLKALTPEESLFLETLPDGRRRLLFHAEVCMDRGALEVFLCKARTKEHEAVLSTGVPPEFLHAALIAAGAEKGTPVQFVNPKTGEEEYQPATGETIRVLVHYQKDGKVITRPAQEWVREIRTEKPMTHAWVFAGSRFMKNPDRPDDPPYYTANNGEIIGISNFPDSMLVVPVAVSQDYAELAFEVRTVEVPPVGSRVWVILEPTGLTRPKKDAPKPTSPK